MLPPLQAIIDVELAERAGWSPHDLARAYLDGGARFLQIRAKALASGRFLELCDAIVADARQAGAIVIVNDRIDLAKLSGADGTHVGQDDLPVADARAQLGSEAIIGFSTHTIAQVRASLDMPASYTAVGPVFGTRSKNTGYEAVGLDLVSAAHAVCGSRPIVAIGGITIDTVASVLTAGATSVAVIGDLMAGGDPAARVSEYVRALR
jgi:thiamine-phosphate pyrophosphorylase